MLNLTGNANPRIAQSDMWAFMERIRERAQELCEYSLEVRSYIDMDGMSFSKIDPYLYIVEFERAYFLYCIPYKKRRKTLFSINTILYGASEGKREVRCHIFDAALHDMIKEEMRKFTDVQHLTGVEVMFDFPSRID